eukprot:6488993-Amphidinium_carterae.2
MSMSKGLVEGRGCLSKVAGKAWDETKNIYDIKDVPYELEWKNVVADQLSQAFINAKVGLILHAMVSETVKSKLREAVRVPVKELKASLGKDALEKLLPAPLNKEVQKVVAIS